MINPSGIIFSENAKLDIGGSFIASTASSIDFGNGLQFSANKLSQPEPLLSINVPIGLQFAGISGVIKVQGAGHSINSSEVYSPLTAQNFTNGLQVKPGNTLALIGGNILLEGGIISTQNGKIELQSLAQGEVTIDQKDRDWILNNKGNQSFADITLLNNALVFAESNNGTANSINVQGKNVNVLSGSLIISQNLSQNVNYDFSRGIIFNNSGILRVQGESKFITSGIFTSNFGRIPGDNIEIDANQAEIEGAQIATTTFNSGSGGKIIFNTNYLKVSGSIPSIANPLGYGGINTFAYSSGNGGDISGSVKEFILENKGSFAAISSSRLLGHSGNINLTAGIINIKSGSSLGSLTFGNGNGGNVFINANNYINVTEEAISLEPSLIQAATFSSGNAGNLEINTPILFVQDGGIVDTSTLDSGNAGNLIINAANSIQISGVGAISNSSSLISSSAGVADENLRVRYNLSQVTKGNSGNVTLNTRNLSISNRAQVTVRNDGPGNAGTLQINADRISITSAGGITATTAIGEGGDIGITSKIIQLRSANISATAGTQGTFGNGGNIRIDTDILSASNNTAITANAFRGRGGNIRINTKGLFISPNTQITASSQRGIDGTVQVNFQNRNPSLTKVQAQDLAKTPEIASVCQGDSDGVASTFVNSGTGGLAASSDNQLDKSSTWQRNSVGLGSIDNSEQSKPLTIREPIEIVEAQGWILNANGDVVLTAQANPPNPYTQVSASKCQEQPSTAKVSSVTEIKRN